MKEDVLFLLRSVRRAPAFAATAMLTLTLGIGATTATFSIVYAVLLRPLSYPDSKVLVHIVGDDPANPRAGVLHSLVEALQGQTSTFQIWQFP
jgi:hypothetical protein